jgi:endo-1,4-beta-D-glucanase Y
MTAWHVTAISVNIEIFRLVWDWAKEKLTTEDFKKLLLGTDNKGRDTWQIAARWGNLEVLQQVWDCAKEELMKEEINNKLLLDTANEG